MFKKCISKILKFNNALAGVFLISLINHPILAKASGFSLDGGASAETIGDSLINKIKIPLRIFGGVAILIAIATVGFGFIMNSGKIEKRNEIMSKIPWIAGGSFILGSLTIVASFLYGLGSGN